MTIQTILDQLGLPKRYKGYQMLACAIDIAVQNDEAVTRITQLIYPKVAETCGISGVNVEKDIRKIIERFWLDGDKEYYHKLAGYKTSKKPTNAEFIAAISSYILRRHPNPK